MKKKNNLFLIFDDFLRYLAFLEVPFFRQKTPKINFGTFLVLFGTPSADSVIKPSKLAQITLVKQSPHMSNSILLTTIRHKPRPQSLQSITPKTRQTALQHRLYQNQNLPIVRPNRQKGLAGQVDKLLVIRRTVL